MIEFPATGEIEYRFYKNPITFLSDPKEDDGFYIPEIFDDTPKCSDKIRSAAESYRRTKQAVYIHARANEWDWFMTYTFNPKKIDSSDYDSVYKSMSKHLENVRSRLCPDMKYLVVPELHSDGLKYHFHGLMSNIDGLNFSDSGKRDKGRIIYNVKNYKLGWTTAMRIGEGESARTSNYLSKYITKGLTYFTPGRQRYLVSKNLDKPIVNDYMMGYEQLQDFKMSLKEKTTSAKVVRVVSGSFSNEVEYINIKL